MENQKIRNYEAKPNHRYVAVLVAAVLLVAAIPVLILSIYAWNRDISVRLVDNLRDDGTLRAATSEELALTLAAADSVDYRWEKSVNNGEFVEVQSVDYEGHGANVGEDADGHYLNVALDGGELNDDQASVAYRLTIDYADGGTEESVTSDTFYVPYYDELRNGSFEVPLGSSPSSQYGNDEYTGMGGVWRSTSEVWGDWNQKNVAIEIVNSDLNFQSSYSWFGDGGAYVGSQFAELNCESAGALYQDVLTIEGESLNYWLAHRARGNSATAQPEYDTMYLVIMPTGVAQTGAQDGGELDTQADLQNYLSGLGVDINISYDAVGSEVVYNQGGILVVRVTSSDQAWQYISAIGGYVPVSGVTRFFFVAGDTASGNNTVGNFLDEVGFSQELPPVQPEQFNLEIRKIISGVDAEELDVLREDSTVTVEAYDAAGEEVTTGLDDVEIAYNDMNWTGSEEEGWTGTYTIANQPLDENVDVYTVTDPETTLEGYQATSTPEVASDTATSSQDVTVAGGETAVTTFETVLISTSDPDSTCVEDDPNCTTGEPGGMGGAPDGDTPNSETPADETDSDQNPDGVGTPDTGANQVVGVANATTALAIAILGAGIIALLVAMAPRLASSHRAKTANRKKQIKK